MKIFLLLVLFAGFALSLPLNRREESPATPAEKPKNVPEKLPATEVKAEEIHDTQDPKNAPEAKPETPSSEAKPETPSGEAKPETPSGEAKPETPSGEAKPETPSGEAKPETPSSEAKPETPSSEAKPETPSSEAKPETPSSEAKPETSSPEAKPETSSSEAKSEIPAEPENVAPESKPETPAPESKSDSSAPESKSESPAPESKSESPAPESKSESPAPESKSESPAPESKSESPVPESKSESPAPESKPESPAPESEHKMEPAAAKVEPSAPETKHDKEPEKESAVPAVKPDKKTDEEDPLASLAKGLALSQMIQSMTLHKRSTDKQETNPAEDLRSSEETSSSSRTSGEEESSKSSETSSNNESSSSSEEKSSKESSSMEEGKRGRALRTDTKAPMEENKKGMMGIPMMMRRRMTRELVLVLKSRDEGEDEEEDQGGEDKGRKHPLDSKSKGGEKPELLKDSQKEAPANTPNGETKNEGTSKKLRRGTTKFGEKREVKAGELIITEKKPGSSPGESDKKEEKQSDDLKLNSGKTSRDFKGSDVSPKTAVLLTVEGRRNAQMKLKETIAKMKKEAEFKSMMQPIPVSEDEKTKTKTGRAILKSGKMQEIAIDSHHTAFVPENEKKAPEEIKVLSQDAIKRLIGAAARTRGAMRMRRSDNYVGSSSDELLVEDMAPIRSAQTLRFAVRNRAPETLRLAVQKELPLLVESPKVLVKELPIIRELPALRESYGGDNILVREEVPVAVRESGYGSSEVRLAVAAPLGARLLQSSPLEDNFNVQIVREHPLKLRKESVLLKSNDAFLLPSERQQYGRSYDQPTSRAIVREESSSYSAPARAILKEEPAEYSAPTRAILKEEPASYSAPARAILKEEPASYSAPARAILKEEPASYSAPARAILKEEPASYEEVVAAPAPIRISAETYVEPAAPASRYRRETMPKSSHMGPPMPMIISGLSNVRSHMATA